MAARPTLICPNCGASFPKGRLACPECGSDENTGWKSQEDIDYESVDIPDVWGEEKPARNGPIPQKVIVVVALITVIAWILFFVL